MAEITQSASGSHSTVSRRKRRSAIKIDMTPMVDLAFLLLTFFVLTTSLNKTHVMDLVMPEETTDAPTLVSAKRVVTFLLGDHNRLYWYQGLADADLKQTNFSSAGLRKVLQTKKTEIPMLVVLIKASEKSTYSNVVDMFDELSIAGIERYST